MSTVSQVIETFGSTYALTDFSNRASVFSKTFKYLEPYINRYGQKNIPLKKVLDNSGYWAMKHYEQDYFLDLLEKSPRQALLWASDWNTKTSQYLYKLKERSFAEIGTKTPALFNLYVWPKSYTQLVLRHIENVAGKGHSYEERKSGAIGLMALIVAMQMGQLLMNKIMGVTKKSRYQSYDFLQAFIWQLGGGSTSIINDNTNALSDLIWAYQYGNKTDKSFYLSTALRTFDRTALSITPFLKLSLSITETMTNRQYISPLRDLYTRMSAKYEKMSTSEKENAFKRTDRDLIQIMQHLVGRSVRESHEDYEKRIKKEKRKGTFRQTLPEKALEGIIKAFGSGDEPIHTSKGHIVH